MVQTDTVFGAEAKKLSGINDGSTVIGDRSIAFREDGEFETISTTVFTTPATNISIGTTGFSQNVIDAVIELGLEDLLVANGGFGNIGLNISVPTPTAEALVASFPEEFAAGAIIYTFTTTTGEVLSFPLIEIIEQPSDLSLLIFANTERLSTTGLVPNIISVEVLSFVSQPTIRLTNTTEIPDWLIPGKYFRANLSGYQIPVAPNPASVREPDTFFNTLRLFPVQNAGNDYKLFRVESAGIVNGRLEIVCDPDFSDRIGVQSRVSGIIDGRISTVVNDPTIARPAENGSTAFNVDIQRSTGLEDGSGVSLKYASHFHTFPNPAFNEYTDRNVDYDQNLLPNGPLAVVDNNGDIVNGIS